MRRRASLLLLVTGSLLLLASLYLPYAEVTSSRHTGTIEDLLGAFSGARGLDGRAAEAATAAALLAVLVVGGSVLAFARLDLADRLPLGLGTLLLSFLGLAVLVDSRSRARFETSLPNFAELHLHSQLDYRYRYGALLGVVGTLILVPGAVALRGSQALPRRAKAAAARALTLGLLVALLLPWRPSPLFLPSTIGIGSPGAVAAAALAIAALAFWRSKGPLAAAARVALATALAVFVGGLVNEPSFGESLEYGAWTSLGFAIALAVVALLFEAPRMRRLAGVRPGPMIAGGAAALFLAGLFLPWESTSRGGVSLSGWTTRAGAASVVLAVMLALAVLIGPPLRAWLAELTVGLALLTATLGLQMAVPRSSFYALGYGALIGLPAVALLLVVALVSLGAARPDPGRLKACLGPIAASVAYLAVVVLPWWDVLPREASAKLAFGFFSWLTIAGALAGIRLLGLWLRRTPARPGSKEGLMALPLLMLALAALDLVRFRDQGLSWGGGTVVGLTILLALVGRIEQRSGLDALRVPAILRVDRL